MRLLIGLTTGVVFWGCGKAPKEAALSATYDAYQGCQQYKAGAGSPPHKGDAARLNERCDIQEPTLTEEMSVRVFFVRHGLSLWNDSGVSESASFLVNGVPREFTDVHLSERGVRGAMELRDWISFSGDCESADHCFLRGTPYEEDRMRRVVFATSNLRRAILTALIAFHGRLAGSNGNRLKINHMHVLSSLQEPSRNTDSILLTPAHDIPYLTFRNDQCPFKLPRMADLFITECAEADKPQDRFARKGLSRFCDWMRDMAVEGLPTTETDPAALKQTGITDFVIIGHSMWIREFFQKYLGPSHQSSLDGKIRGTLTKIANQTVIKFTMKFPVKGTCVIEPGTSEVLHGAVTNRLSPR